MQLNKKCEKTFIFPRQINNTTFETILTSIKSLFQKLLAKPPLLLFATKVNIQTGVIRIRLHANFIFWHKNAIRYFGLDKTLYTCFPLRNAPLPLLADQRYSKMGLFTKQNCTSWEKNVLIRSVFFYLWMTTSGETKSFS